MNRRPQGSSSGSEQQQQQRLARDEDENGVKEGFPSLANGHAGSGAQLEPEKKDQVDAGLKSLDHCMLSLSSCA